MAAEIKTRWAAAGIAALFLVTTFFFINHIRQTRTIAQATSASGVEMKVVQRFTWSGDMFNTSFHFRTPDSNWTWRYYSHEDGYWGHSQVTLDEETSLAHFYRDNTPTIAFNWSNLTYTQLTHTQSGKPVVVHE